MAALSFPSSPASGQVFTGNGSAWQWDGSAWRVVRNTNQNVQLGFGSITFGNASASDAVFKTGQLNASATTLSNPIITGFLQEQVNGIAGTTPAITPNKGTIQLWTLSGNSTPTSGVWSPGQSLTLMVNAGANTITWTSTTFGASGVSWVTGVAPALAASGYTVLEFWKIGTQVYGVLVGSTT